MNFSLKSIAAAVALAAASTGAFAAIDIGSTGNGELYFNIWDANGSYTRDLNVTIDAFESLVAASGAVNQSWAADANLVSFLATADLNTLKWNVVAVDLDGARRLLNTYTPPEKTTTIANNTARSAATNLSTMANTANLAGLNTAGVDSIVVNNGSAAWAGKSSFKDTAGGLLNFSNAGTLANDSFATGLGFLRVDALATGTAKSVYNEYLDGSAVNVWISADRTLHIAAVPEPSEYALLLAGLGMIGFMARRNKRG